MKKSTGTQAEGSVVRVRKYARFLAILVLIVSVLNAAEHRGQVKFNGLALPGATVTATQGDRTIRVVADENGNYFFADLPDGMWTFEVEMSGFATAKQDAMVEGTADLPAFDVKMLSFDEIKAVAAPPAPRISVTENPSTTNTASAAPAADTKNSKNKKGNAAAAAANGQNSFQRAAVNANPNAAPASSDSAEPAASGPFAGQSASDLSQRASDGLLINGSQNNGASSPFAQAASFGNNRRGPNSLYNGSFAIVEDNSALDAKTFSYTGLDTPKPQHNHLTALFNFGGPIKIPHLIRNGPQLTFNYQRVINSNAQTETYEVPTAAQLAGNFAGLPQLYYPQGNNRCNATPGTSIPGNQIPVNCLDPVAQNLLKYFPQPNFTGSSRFNYQIPVVGETHQDQMRAQLNKNIGNRNFLYGFYGFQRAAGDTNNEYAFLDKSHGLGQIVQANWQHRFSQRLFAHFQFQFSRQSNATVPFFANRVNGNVSGDAGITGNNQEPVNYGPPTLLFSSGISPLSDGNSTITHNQTAQYSYDGSWNRGRHNITWGTDYKRLQFNNVGQANPRGSFQFTGLATSAPGSALPNFNADFADFLLGVPDTSAISNGNADKYFRQNLFDVYLHDDWRIGPSLTVNYGLRWDYQPPVTELYGRLANLDILNNFAQVAPVEGTNNCPQCAKVGPLTGIHYPDSLLHTDMREFSPRVGLAWRPIPASSLVVRAGYSIGFDTSIYQSIANQLATQPPFSTTLSVSNVEVPLTLARGFVPAPNTVTNTYALDPNLRVGYAQTWQASVQRDLPGSLVMIATYLGIKGTRGLQEFLPNTFPNGAANPCPGCPSGFTYITSNGNSTRQSGSLQLRRRLRNGFLASATYTFAKAIDDSALGGRGQGSNVIAQNWLNLSAERGLSSFDQRHTLAFQTQYTSGQGIGGGTLLSGWRGALLKEWTIATTINVGTGTPLTPQVPNTTAGTGVNGVLRPDVTGVPLFPAPSGYAFNPAAFVAAPAGQYGDAGRSIITGPLHFSLNGSLGRTFRLKDRYSLDLRVDATNALNHVTYTSYITNVGPQFGLLSTNTNAMRSLVTNLRLRF